MENPLLLMFLLGFVLGTCFGMYFGNKKFRAMVNKMIRGKEHDEDEGDDKDYEEHDRRYGDGPYRNNDRTRR